MKIYCEPGNEKYIKWAKAQLARLSDLREDLRVPALAKSFKVDADTLISLKASEFENIIRIFGAPAHGAFVVYPTATQISSPFTSFSFFSEQEAMPVKNLAIETFPDYKNVSMKYRRSNGITYTEASGLDTTATPLTEAEWRAALGDATFNALMVILGLSAAQLVAALNATLSTTPHPGFFIDEKNRIFTGVTTPTINTTYMPFKHIYTDSGTGEPATKILLITPHVNNPSIFEPEVTAALSETGTITNSIDDISPNGQIGLGLKDDLKARIAINYDGVPIATKSETTLSGYGSETEIDNFSSVGGQNASQSHTEEFSWDATYPVCFGFSSSSAEQQISIREIGTSSGAVSATSVVDCVVDFTVFCGHGTLTTTASESLSETVTHRLIMPNGVERDFVISTRAQSGNTQTITDLNGFCEAVCGTLSSSASGSVTALVIGELEMLYADASVSAVVYRYTKKTYNMAAPYTTGGWVDSTTTMLVETSIVALVGNSEKLVYSESETVATDSAYGSPTDGEPTFPGYGGGSGSSTVVTPLNINTWAIKARQQLDPLSVAIQSQDHYVGQYTHDDDTTHIFGTGSPRQALIDRFIEILAAKETADPPTITTAEQLFLNNLRAGTLTDYNLNLQKASPFGISLV